MSRYVLQRIAGMLAVMFVVVTVVFVIVRIAPGDPAAVMLGPDATPQDVAALRARLGLDRPLARAVRALPRPARARRSRRVDLPQPPGDRRAGRARRADLLPDAVRDADRRASIAHARRHLLGLSARLAVRPGDDHGSRCSAASRSRASGWGCSLIQFFAVRCGCFPVAGYGGPGASLRSSGCCHLVLPALALGIVSSALILRFTRASMLDVLGDDYIRTARAKGHGRVPGGHEARASRTR